MFNNCQDTLVSSNTLRHKNKQISNYLGFTFSFFLPLLTKGSMKSPFFCRWRSPEKPLANVIQSVILFGPPTLFMCKIPCCVDVCLSDMNVDSSVYYPGLFCVNKSQTYQRFIVVNCLVYGYLCILFQDY